MAKRIIRLTESQLTKLIEKVISESEVDQQAISEVNSILSEFGLKNITKEELDSASTNVFATSHLEMRFSDLDQPNPKIDKEALKQQAKEYFCKYASNKEALKKFLRDFLSLVKGKKTTVKEQDLGSKDWIYIAAFVVLLLVCLITGVRHRKYGCPDTWGKPGY